LLAPKQGRDTDEIHRYPQTAVDSFIVGRRLSADLLNQLVSGSAWFEPLVAVADCCDVADNKYLELAWAAEAAAIVSSDQDLLVLHPWRGIAILRPAEYLTRP
jgi:predicted nucleic acid-binding protein